MLKGADIVLRCLRAEGVELVFGYPGGAIMPLYDALEGSGVRHILTRHEQGAVFAAEGYARVTGEVGVAMATSGPGATVWWHRCRLDRDRRRRGCGRRTRSEQVGGGARPR